MEWTPLQCSEMLLESPPKGCALPRQGLPGVKCHEVGIYLASSGKKREEKGEEKHIPPIDMHKFMQQPFLGRVVR